MKPVPDLRHSAHKNRGVIAVELALVLPLLVWILMGVVDLGLLSREHQVLQNAAREGARLSAQPGGRIDPDRNPNFTLNDLRAYVIRYASREGVTVAAGDITVNQSHSVTIGGVLVTASRITVVKDYQPITPGMGTLLGTIRMAGEGIYKNLY